jgi:transcriptional regulator with XRE-family HTH domain
MTIGENIRAIRRTKTVELPMLPKDLAGITGIPAESIRRYERGVLKPSEKRLAILAAALGVTIQELKGDTQ